MPLSRKLAFAMIAFFALCLGSTATARADTVNIVGNTNGNLATATMTCTFNAQTNTFTFTINNTSPFDARITGIGFDLPPVGNADPAGLSLNGSVVFQPTDVNFVFENGNLGNVPQFNDVVLDFGFITGSNFAGGNPNDGLPPGIDVGEEATFTVSGAAFAGFTEEQICEAVFVRFQRVGANGELSDVGTPGEPMPEPTTMLLLGTGLTGIAARVRRRRNAAQK